MTRIKITHKGSLVDPDMLIWFKQVFHFKNSWILLPGLTALSLVYATHSFNVGTQPPTSRGFLEPLALYLVPIILVVLVTKSLIGRDPLIIYLAVLSLVFLIRELDETVLTIFGGTFEIRSKRLVDVVLVGMGIWAWVWRKKLCSCLNRSMILKVSLFGVFWTYLFSQLIARRVFRGVFPNESLLHVPMEEAAETAAHLFLLVFACLCQYTKRKPSLS